MESLQARFSRPKAPYSQRGIWTDYRLPPTGNLAGRQIALERDDGQTVAYTFDDKHVRWEDPEDGSIVEAPYDGVELREGVFSIEILHPALDDNPSVRLATSLALHTGTGGALIVRHTVVMGDEPTFLQEIYPCRIEGSGASLPELSAELVGRRAYAEYADGRAAEHVYLNPRRFAWQGLDRFDYSGAGCEDSTTWKLDDELFLLTWVEEWEPTGVVLLMDFSALRNAGVILGRDDEGFFHLVVGGRLAILGQTTYPQGYEPPGLYGQEQERA